jgi:hypothetical protein
MSRYTNQGGELSWPGLSFTLDFQPSRVSLEIIWCHLRHHNCLQYSIYVYLEWDVRNVNGKSLCDV